MKAQQITDLLVLHKKAAKVLQDILNTKQDIAGLQEKLVLNDKDMSMPSRMKHYWYDSYTVCLTENRKLLLMQSEQYAIIAQQLAEPFMPKESYLVTTIEVINA